MADEEEQIEQVLPGNMKEGKIDGDYIDNFLNNDKKEEEINTKLKTLK